VPSGIVAYSEYLKEQVAEEEARKASFEQRGLAVVTTAGTLVTLLFGLSALSMTALNKNPLLHGERLWLGIALGLFLLSAITALLTNMPRGYEVVDAADIEARLNEDPVRDDEAARLDIAFTQVNVLSAAKGKNASKGKLLFAALVLELIAVSCLGVAIFEVVRP
jgi:hypothetical protein